jgi:ABC-2 type transport system ATP-binding protein
MPAIQLTNLSKTFGKRKQQVHAVRGIDLTVAKGQVYGFLGPNGAGKSTTIRMIMSLIRPTTGDVQLFGKRVSDHHHILQKVGALVEGATFYDFLTGRKNLEVLARTSGHYDPAKIQTLLDQVNMADRADRPVKGYSTGMKQRLGLAAALLANPELVILDEPTNGLDPAGIQEMRTFIRDLVAKQGRTVFLSSHILNEVEQLCDRVAIISHGEIVREGNVGDLLDSHIELTIEADPLPQAIAILQENWEISPNGVSLKVNATRADTPAIISQLVAQNIAIYQVNTKRQSLESFFLEATS